MAAGVLSMSADGTGRWGSFAPPDRIAVPGRPAAGEPGRPAAQAHGNQVMAQADDRALVEACVGGDRSAFDVLVERHRKQVYQVCYRFTGNHEDASDLAQDVFVRAYRALRTFKGQSAFSTWLYRVAVNAGLNHVAVKRPAFEAMDAHEPEDTTGERPDGAVLRQERAATVRAAIARLPRKQRATMILRVYHELPHEQIAAILGSSVGAAKANFFHALGNLRKLLQESGR
jgi:RNA polymerase sigma-70 factor (ECF subfamily)